MPVNAGSAFVSIVPDMTKFATGVQAGVQKATTGVQGTVNRFSQGITSALTSPWTLAGIAVAGFAASSIKAFQESETVLAQLRIAVGGATGAYEEQATALQALTGFQDEEILAADAVLARFDLTESQMRSLIPLILDYARATGQDAAGAAEAIGKALLGNTRALKTVGIEFTATGDRAADLSTIMGALQDKVGGAAEAFGETSAGKMEIFQARLNDIQEEIGQFLIPIFEKLVQAGSDIITIFQEIGDVLPKTGDGFLSIGKAVQLLLTPFTLLLDYTHKFAELLGDVEVKTATYAGTTEDLIPLIEMFGGSTQSAADAAQAMADAEQAAAEAARELTKDLPGLIGAVLNLKDAQHDLAEAQKDTSTTAAELRDKELAVVNAFLNVRGEFAGLIQDFKAGDATVGDVIGKFRDMARRAGLSKAQINDLIGVIRNYIDALGDIPTSVTTQVNVQGGQQFPGSHQQLAEGGIVRRPTFALIGESGPEAVIPLNKAAGMGNINVTVNGWVGSDQAIALRVREVLLREKPGLGGSLGLA